MTACFSWLLNARLHLTLAVALIASVVERSGPAPEPAPDSRFNDMTTITYLDRSNWSDDESMPAVEERVTMASVSAEVP